MHKAFKRGFEKKADTVSANISDAGVGASLLDRTRGPRKTNLAKDKAYLQNQPTVTGFL